MESQIEKIFQNVLEGEDEEIKANVQAALEAGLEPSAILNEGMIAAMAEVGRLFENGEFFVPEMLIAGRAMQSGLNVLKPHLLEGDAPSKGKVVIGTVKGDLHDIGKNLVALMLEGAGFEIIDLGTDVTPEAFVEAAKENNAELVGLSALLTTTMAAMETTVAALREAGLPQAVKIMVGGAPVTQAYAEEIGADGFAPDASRAVTLAQSLL